MTYPIFKEGTLVKLTKASMGVPKTDQLMMVVKPDGYTTYAERSTHEEMEVAYLVHRKDLDNPFARRHVGSNEHFYVRKQDVEVISV